MGSIYRTYPLPLPKCSSVPYRRTPDSSGVTQADDNNTATYGKLGIEIHAVFRINSLFLTLLPTNITSTFYLHTIPKVNT